MRGNLRVPFGDVAMDGMVGDCQISGACLSGCL